MFVNRIFEMGATGGGSAILADGVAKVKGTDTVVPGTFSFQEGTPGWFDELGENLSLIHIWATNTVVHILENREYTGCLVNFKTEKLSYKVKHSVETVSYTHL